MSFSKQAHEAALAKVAAADQVEAQHAVDAGFGLACQRMGLNPTQIQKLAAVAKAKIDKAAEKTKAGAKAGAPAAAVAAK